MESAFVGEVRSSKPSQDILALTRAVAFASLLAFFVPTCGYAQAQGSSAERAFQTAVDLERQGKLRDAIHAYQQILSANPQDVRALNNLGAVLARQERYREAIEIYQRTLAINP